MKIYLYHSDAKIAESFLRKNQFFWINKNMNMNYNNRVIIKPWGEEYVIFKNKKIAITYLKIKRDIQLLYIVILQKKLVLILKGTAEVQVGIYKNIKKYNPLSILVLRPGLFYKIKANNKTDLYALEIENPYLKQDLVRMEDNYGRRKKGYESLKNSRKLNSQDIIFKIPRKNKNYNYSLNGIKINIAYYKNFNSFNSKKIKVFP